MTAYSEVLEGIEAGSRERRDGWLVGVYVYIDPESILPLIGRGDPRRDVPFVSSGKEHAATDWTVIDGDD